MPIPFFTSPTAYPENPISYDSEGYRVHMERTGRSNGLMMGYFGNAEAPDAPFSFYYCDHLYSDSWNKTEPGGARQTA